MFCGYSLRSIDDLTLSIPEIIISELKIFDNLYFSFSGRDVRDKCSEVGIDYQPPDFVVNALQHTTVQCSWDEGEKDRERKLTNISQWRQLQESELLQYVASSDSDDEENDEGDEDEDSEDSNRDVNKGRSTSNEASGRRKKRYLSI